MSAAAENTNAAAGAGRALSPARAADEGTVLSAPSGDLAFVRRLLIAVLLLGALVAAWMLADLLLLLFAAVLVGILLRTIADAVRPWLRIGERLSLLVAGLLIVLILGTTFWLFGAQIVEQVRGLAQRLPRALDAIAPTAELRPMIDALMGSGSALGIGSLIGKLVTWSTTAVGIFAAVVIAVFGGIYLSLDPPLYRDGFLKLVPPSLHPHVGATLDDSGDALRRWLGAQVVAMIAVGLLVGTGLFLIGVPSAVALALIAAVAEFIPYVGPAVAAVPALIIAGSQDWATLGWTLALYVGVQQVENLLLMPLLASRSVSIPPAVAMFGIVAMGLLFGPLGLLLGFPLLVVLDVAIRRLYVLDALGEPVEILGEPAVQSETQAANGQRP